MPGVGEAEGFRIARTMHRIVQDERNPGQWLRVPLTGVWCAYMGLGCVALIL
jgi:hypothetical protein